MELNNKGKLPLSVMTNPALPLYAKAIYAYLSCCNNSSSNPIYIRTRDMQLDLSISNKHVIYKYCNNLSNLGYLRRGVTNNLMTYYELVGLSPTIDDRVVRSGGADEDITKHLLCNGYCVIDKSKLSTKGLSTREKAFYAYLCAMQNELPLPIDKLQNETNILCMATIKKYIAKMQEYKLIFVVNKEWYIDKKIIYKIL